MKLRQPVDVPVTSPSVQTEVYREFDKADYLAACTARNTSWPAT